MFFDKENETEGETAERKIRVGANVRETRLRELNARETETSTGKNSRESSESSLLHRKVVEFLETRARSCTEQARRQNSRRQRVKFSGRVSPGDRDARR